MQLYNARMTKRKSKAVKPPSKRDDNNKRDAKKKAAFLEAFRASMHVGRSAELAGIARPTVYAWRKRDANFKRKWDAVEADVTEDFFHEAVRRAFTGTVKPVIHKGQIAFDREGKDLYLREWSDTLLMFIMKSRDPFKYCDRARTAKIERRWAKLDAKNGEGDSETTAAADALAALAALVNEKAAAAKPATFNA